VMWIKRLEHCLGLAFLTGNLGTWEYLALLCWEAPFALRCGTVGVTVGVTLAVTVWSLLWDAWSSLDAHMSSVRRYQVSSFRNLAV
jgi:hypothetical protein